MHGHAALSPLTEAPPETWRDELRALLALAGPLVGANLLQMAVFAVDVVFVARLGPVEFAAATLGVFLFNVLAFALVGLVGAAEPLIAAALGARVGAVRQVRRSFRMGMWLAGLGTIVVVALLNIAEPLLRLAGQDAAVSARAGVFCRILSLAVLPAVLSALMRMTAAALGRPGWAMVVTLLALGVAILANWCLVFGNGGFPALGLEGSALASVTVSFASCLAYAAILVTDRKLRRFHLFGKWWRTEWSRMREIVKLGAPIALGWVAEGGLFGGAGLLMGLISVTAIDAHAVALNIAAIAFQIPFGLAQAATIRVGFAYGARDAAWVGRAGGVAIALGIGVMVATAAALWAVPHLLVRAYVDPVREVAVAVLAVKLLGVAAVFQLVDGAQAVAAGVLRGVQDTRVPMMIQVVGYWVMGFGTAAFLGFTLGWQAIGIWWGLAAGLGVVSALLLWRWSMRGRLGLLPARAA
ncbi:MULTISPECIES: MATE family efflux transporter [Sphingomonas]|jgi:MATE family multidrug resistance protein|uniref:MATE family efflux transporter n=1 Tax=Sphingomonas TaxID=13687 RepID=UPI000AB4F5F2|nr:MULTISPECIES: MATE family efflux transporter [Sphingomonas]MBY0300546.1 MATE family efflux transporter [Sphingomonas ginsenosidimutans]